MTRQNPIDHKRERFEASLAELAALRKTGLIRSPLMRGLWYRGLLRVGNGRHADKAHAMMANILQGPLAAAAFLPPRSPQLPRVDPRTAILLGYEVGGTRPPRPILIDRNTLVLHTLLLGESGMGKSYLMMSIIEQINRQNRCLAESI